MSNDDTSPPGPIPLPPVDLDERRLPIRVFSDVTWYRGHKATHGPIFFNTTRGRWTDPDHEFGTVYLGESAACSFIEAFNQQVQRTDWGYFVSERVLAACCLCPITSEQPLRLVDLTSGLNLLQVGADNRICDGPHDVSRRWARAFWKHPDQPDGIYFRSRHAPELFSIAVFERSRASLMSDCASNVLRDVHLLSQLLDYFDVALLT